MLLVFFHLFSVGRGLVFVKTCLYIILFSFIMEAVILSSIRHYITLMSRSCLLSKLSVLFLACV
jgi:hypothetical protein